ncbi:MAG: DMT family transporter [Deltaproteobacteria bacterium]|nr:DMT family transporter [Deltaproteobacteria bacterium]
MGVLQSGELFSLGCAVLWSGATILFRKSGEHVPPVALNLFKDTVALLLFLVTLPLLGVPFAPSDQGWREWLVLLASGAVGIGIADSLFLASLNRLGAGGNAIVSALYAPFAVLASFAYLHEAIGPLLLLATAMMVGAIVLNTWQPRAGGPRPERSRVLSGVSIGTLAMFLMAVAIVYAKPVLDRSDAWWAASVRLLGGVVFLAGQGLVRPRLRSAIVRCFRPSRQWAVTLPAAVLGAYLAMIVWILGMKYTFASTAAVLNQSSTLWTVLLGWLVLHERMNPRKALAMALAFGGSVVAVL